MGSKSVKLIAEKTYDFGTFPIDEKTYKTSIICKLFEGEKGKTFHVIGKITDVENAHEYGVYGRNTKVIHALVHKYSNDAEKLKLIDKIYNSWLKYNLNDFCIGTKKQERFVRLLDIPEKVNASNFIMGALKGADLYEDNDRTMYELIVPGKENSPIILASTYNKTTSFRDIQRLYEKMHKIENMEDAMEFVRVHFPELYFADKKLAAKAILENNMSIESSGFKYGHAWFFEKIPAKALKTIEELTGYKEKEKEKVKVKETEEEQGIEY